MQVKLVSTVMMMSTLLTGSYCCKAEKIEHRISTIHRSKAEKFRKAEKKKDPIEREYVDCEDVETNGPCVTFDDAVGGWALVLQYEPKFVERKIAQCKVEDGGPILPCVWKHRDKRTNKWIVYSVK